MIHVLRALHQAGRIRSPWLPGMLGVRRRHDPPELIRVLQLGSDGRPICWAARDPDEGPDEWVVCTESVDGWPGDVEVADDPATTGCLLALVQEASGDPTYHARWTVLGYWLVERAEYGGVQGRASTEGGAISVALTAIAEAL